MKIFFDTNVVLEFLQKRLQADLIEEVLDIASENNYELYISVGGFYTLTYLIEQHLRKTTNIPPSLRTKELRNILLGVLEEFSIAPHNNNSLKSGVEDEAFTDLEDSYQAEAAINSGCDILLTINIKDFEGLRDGIRIKVITPSEFIELFEK